MKKVVLAVGVFTLTFATSCLGFSTEVFEPDITNSFKSFKALSVGLVGNPHQNVGHGTVIDIQSDGTLTFIDTETGTIRIATVAGMNFALIPGDEVTFIYIVTPNGMEMIKKIMKAN